MLRLEQVNFFSLEIPEVLKQAFSYKERCSEMLSYIIKFILFLKMAALLIPSFVGTFIIVLLIVLLPQTMLI